MSVQCPACNGEGYFVEEGIVGYVSREMAMDACDMAYENQPVYGTNRYQCIVCEGFGEVTEEQEEEYIKAHPFKVSDDELPF